MWSLNGSSPNSKRADLVISACVVAGILVLAVWTARRRATPEPEAPPPSSVDLDLRQTQVIECAPNIRRRTRKFSKPCRDET